MIYTKKLCGCWLYRILWTLISHQETTWATWTASDGLQCSYKKFAVRFYRTDFRRRDSSVSTCGFIITTVRSYKPSLVLRQRSHFCDSEGTDSSRHSGCNIDGNRHRSVNEKCQKRQSVSFPTVTCGIKRLEPNSNFLLALTVARTVTGCNTMFGYIQYTVFRTWQGGRNTDYRGDRFIEDMNVLHVLGNCSGLCMVTVLQ